MGKKGKSNYVTLLVKSENETPDMKEVREKVHLLVNTYIFLGSKQKLKTKKQDNKEKKKEKANEVKELEVKSVNSPIVNPSPPVPVPRAGPVSSAPAASNKLLSLSQSDPDVLSVSFMDSDEESLTPKIISFLDSDRSPKLLEKAKKSGKEGGKPQPPTSKGAKKDSPQISDKISSSVSAIAPSPKNKWNVDRHKWEERRQKLTDKGYDLDDVLTGRRDLQKWDGVSKTPADKRKKTFYVVWSGCTIGVFTTWAKAQKSISGFSKAGYQKVTGTEREAIQLLEEKLKDE